MHSPTAALAWELWHRHRPRILFVAGTLLFYILVYPRLCAAISFDPGRPDAVNEMGRHMAAFLGQKTLFNIAFMLLLLFIGVGPTAAMVVTLLCTIWIFAFTEKQPKTRDLLIFPVRLFTLPISTDFLFWRLAPGGMAAVAGLCAIWNHCVPVPRLEIFEGYQNCFAWLTILVLTQAIVWSLAAWPATRTLAVLAVLYQFLASPMRGQILEAPLILLAFFVPGLLLARMGLGKIRHGRWQAWAWQGAAWRRRLSNWTAGAALLGPRRFASPAQAQFWFEWRRSTARICFITMAAVLIPTAFLIARAALGYEPLDADAVTGIALMSAGVPVLVFSLLGLSPTRTDLPFLMTHPLASHEIVLGMLKASAIGALLSWVGILAALGALPWIGNTHDLAQRMPALFEAPNALVAGRLAALAAGMIFLAWRGAVVNLCFVLSGNWWLCQLPGLIILAGSLGAIELSFLTASDAPMGPVRRYILWLHLSQWLAGLLAVKFLLAFAAFRAALKRRLLAPSAVVTHLVVWGLLVAALLAANFLLAYPKFENPGAMLPACLGIGLLVPLARIGLAPLTLARARRTSSEDSAGQWAWPRFRSPPRG